MQKLCILYDMWNIGSAYKLIIKFVKRQGSKKGIYKEQSLLCSVFDNMFIDQESPVG